MILLNTENDTKRFAELLGKMLHPVDCITLTGTLGAGKTTLMRYLIQSLSQEETVLSPSFTIVQEYDVINHQSSITIHPTKLYHLDGYRLGHPSEIPELGLEEMLESGMVAIEWPEIFAGYLPQNRLDITIEALANQQRRISLMGRGHHASTATQLNQEFTSHG